LAIISGYKLKLYYNIFLDRKQQQEPTDYRRPNRKCTQPSSELKPKQRLTNRAETDLPENRNRN